ncbi:hypothetical protein RQCS_60800 (plasmid) [Rhodococcus qingshengii]|uniref:hypothetical protein n=1 Tax=Rhodococcus qingshengii TaxID=334542 RepID=UPI0007E5980C|nr:hypothetical protein [Rhodococcus qingshengii]BCF86535.1 hypothetical protein RQCS_60800 [Rhodococcus qingshengii]
MTPARRFDRTSPTTVVSTVVVLAAMVIALLALLIFAPTSSAGPAEDCAAVRARDHQIYLNLIASLPPGAPVPPEVINPCLTAPSTTATAAPTTTVGLPGVQAPGGGPNVGANAPTNFPTYNGTPIVPVPTIEVRPIASESPTSENGAGAPPDASTPQVPSPTFALNPAPGEGTTPDRGPGPIPAATPNSVPGQPESTPTVTTSGLDEGDGRDRYLELVLVGAAGFTAAGIGVRGRPGPFSARESGKVTPLPQTSMSGLGSGGIFRPGYEELTVVWPGGAEQTFDLLNGPESPREYYFPKKVPPGGHMRVNADGSADILDANGTAVSHEAPPWAYDALGRPVPTWYEVGEDGTTLIQHIEPGPDVLYPIFADGLDGGTNEATGHQISAVELSNGQEAITGQPGGIAVVGTPDDGHSAYVPNPETMKPDAPMTVDQGDGTTNNYTKPGDSSGTGLEVSTVPTTQALDTMAAEQEHANQEAAAAAEQAAIDREILEAEREALEGERENEPGLARRVWDDVWDFGDEALDVTGDAAGAFAQAMLDNPGAAASIVGGMILAGLGGTVEGGGVVLDATGIGLPAGLALNAVGAAAIAGGATLAGAGMAEVAPDIATNFEARRYGNGTSGNSGSTPKPSAEAQRAPNGEMLGQSGTQLPGSKNLTPEIPPNGPYYRIDVENPVPGERAGQMHLQDDRGGKYYYNFNTQEFEGAPQSLIKKIQGDNAYQNALRKGAYYLGAK